MIPSKGQATAKDQRQKKQDQNKICLCFEVCHAFVMISLPIHFFCVLSCYFLANFWRLRVSNQTVGDLSPGKVSHGKKEQIKDSDLSHEVSSINAHLGNVVYVAGHQCQP